MLVALPLCDRYSRRFLFYNFQLAFIWLLGQFVGCFFASNISVSTIAYITDSGFCNVSFAWLMVSVQAPFLVGFFSLKYDADWLILLVLFVKGVFFAFCIWCIGTVFNSAAWIARWLCFFSNGLCTALFLWYVFSFPKSSKTKRSNTLIACSIISFFVTCIDYLFILPFFVKLLE